MALLDYEKRGAWGYGANRELVMQNRQTSRFVPRIDYPFSVVDPSHKVVERFKTRAAAESAAQRFRAALRTYYSVAS
jgi:hypothetical protein